MALGLHLISRGVQFTAQAGADKPRIDLDISPYAPAIFAITAIIYYVAMFKIRYTLGNVIGTLTIIEQPESDVLVEVDTIEKDGLDKATDGLLESEMMVIKKTPVTSKIRTAVAHLKSRAGRRSRFRGLGAFIVLEVLTNLVAIHLSLLAGKSHIGNALAVIAAQVLFSPLEMAWYHIIMSAPSTKRWYQRVQLRKNWMKIAPAALLKATTWQLTVGLPAAILCSSSLTKQLMKDPSYELSKEELRNAAIILGGAILTGISYLFLLYVPAYVTMVRVSASMLPEDDEAIVNFDRSFDGKVAPAVVGGAGKVGLLEAWRSFTWEARRRYVRLLVKIAAIMTAVTAVFGMIFAAEFNAFVGPQTKGLVKGFFREQDPH